MLIHEYLQRNRITDDIFREKYKISEQSSKKTTAVVWLYKARHLKAIDRARATWPNQVLEDVKKRVKSSKNSGEMKRDASCPVHYNRIVGEEQSSHVRSKETVDIKEVGLHSILSPDASYIVTFITRWR
jgi:hypothetical protein